MHQPVAQSLRHGDPEEAQDCALGELQPPEDFRFGYEGTPAVDGPGERDVPPGGHERHIVPRARVDRNTAGFGVVDVVAVVYPLPRIVEYTSMVLTSPPPKVSGVGFGVSVAAALRWPALRRSASARHTDSAVRRMSAVSSRR